MMTGRVTGGGAPTHSHAHGRAAAQVIGGGLPVGAYGGKKEIMQMVAPAGPMYQVHTRTHAHTRPGPCTRCPTAAP
jgi:glutamate-1-semialdehyde 2,1-aminomutase